MTVPLGGRAPVAPKVMRHLRDEYALVRLREEQELEIVTGKQFREMLHDNDALSRRCIIRGLLHRDLTIIAGLPTGGKSTFAYNLMAAYLSGGSFLNLEVAEPTGQRVLFVTTDVDGNFDAHRAMEALGVDGGRYSLREFQPIEREYPLEWWSRLARFLANDGYGCVVIDNASGLLPDTATINSDSDARAVISKVRTLSAAGLAVVLLTHTNNTGTFGGSVEWRKAVRYIYTIDGKAPAETRTIKTTNNTDQLPPTKIRLASDGVSVELVNPTAKAKVKAKAEPKPSQRPRESKRDRNRQALVDAVKASGAKTVKEAAMCLFASPPTGVTPSTSVHGWEQRIARANAL